MKKQTEKMKKQPENIFDKYGDEPTIMDAIEHKKQTEREIEHKKANNLWLSVGASNHTSSERQVEDFYATDKTAVDRLMFSKKEYAPDKDAVIWECAVGNGVLAERLQGFGYTVVGSDLVDRSNGKYPVADFLKTKREDDDSKLCIFTNPPYSVATNFVKHAVEMLKPGERCYMLLRTLFLEGQKRQKELFQNPNIQLAYVLQFGKRINCRKNGIDNGTSGAQAYAWFVFEKPVDGKKKPTIVDWI